MSLCCCFRRKVNTHNCIHTVEILCYNNIHGIPISSDGSASTAFQLLQIKLERAPSKYRTMRISSIAVRSLQS